MTTNHLEQYPAQNKSQNMLDVVIKNNTYSAFLKHSFANLLKKKKR
jgi:hypothetical protein